MNIFIVDISGKVVNYDIALCEALTKQLSDNIKITFFSPLYRERPQCATIRLIKLIPLKYKASKSPWKRATKIIELFLNYTCMFIYALIKKPDLIHFQWLPFIEISGVEYYVLSIYKLLLPKIKIVLTVHNVYPHSLKEKKYITYIKRFTRINRLIDAYIVHTASSKEELSLKFNINNNKIIICPHGVFKAICLKPYVKEDGSNNKINILMFGLHSYYKGTDILVEAVNKLSDKNRALVDVRIVGLIEESYYHHLRMMDKAKVIKWSNYFLSDEELGDVISWSDLIVLPYRKISQSGVLLMALNSKKMIICSDLPSFKETIHGEKNEISYDEFVFFKSEDTKSLSMLIDKYIKRIVPQKELLGRMEELSNEYKWEKSAEKTLQLYKNMFKHV